jgi:RHS repeat-associated protein
MNILARSVSVALLCISMAAPLTAAERSATEFSRFTKSGPIEAAAPGQTRTLLPDGRWLFVGGLDSGKVSASIVTKSEQPKPPKSGSKIAELTARLIHPRSSHTATVLPDGTVLILGGVDADGAIVTAAEVFDPASGEITVIADSGLTPRSHHSATLLTDGYVLVTGGLSSDGKPLQQAELWNPETQRIEPVANGPLAPRSHHSAALLADGKGLIWGGQDSSGQPLTNGEIYDPAATAFSEVAPTEPSLPSTALREAPPAMEASIPQANATDAPVDGRVAVRFSNYLQVRSVSGQSVTLVGPAGAVEGKVVAAGDGLLLFFTPRADLLPNATYTVFLRGLLDEHDRALPWSAFKFTTRSLHAQSSSSGGGTITVDVPSVVNPEAASAVDANRPEEQKKKDDPKRQEEKEREKAATDDDFEDWIPGEHHRHGQWRVLGTRNEPRTSKALLRSAPLQAAARTTTAISGRVARLNGLPLEGVTIRAGNVTALTDAQGRFILAGVRAGTQEITVDGGAVTSGGRRYATHFIRVEVAAKRTTVLDQPIYLSRLNPANDITIPSPADRDLVLTHPDIPGLELHIPKGAVLRTRDGRIISKLNIAPLPIDRVPFALPDGFPVYFTIQPAGAFVDGSATGTAKGMRVIYPNYLDAPAGTRMTFWNYDPTGLGWQVYGRGTVSENGKQVIPDADVEQRNFMAFGYGFDNYGKAPEDGPNCEQEAHAGDPVDCATGLFFHRRTDLAIADTIPLSVTRVYRTNDGLSRDFGIGANHNYAMFLNNPSGSTNTSTPPAVDLIMPDGRKVRFEKYSGTGAADVIYKHTSSPSSWLGATLQWNVPNDVWEITTLTKTVYSFSPHAPNVLRGIRDRYGNAVTIVRVGEGGNIQQVRSPNGRTLTFTYDVANRITRIRDNLGRVTRYEYDAQGRLSKAYDPDNKFERYEYNSAHRMTAVIDKRGNTMVTNVYDAYGRVSQQTLADGAVWGFDYTLGSNGKISQTSVTNPRGYVKQMSFNREGYLTQVIHAVGQPEQQIFTYERDRNSNQRARVVDPLGRVAAATYDYAGHLTSVTQLSGTADAVRSEYTYDPVSGNVTSQIDPLEHTTRFEYDNEGNLIALTDALNNTATGQYDERGRITTLTNALGKSAYVSYESGDISEVTDPLGRTTSYLPDAVGRTLANIDAAGNRNRFEYDLLDRVSRSIDPRGGATVLTYDENGNTRSVRDPRDLASHEFTYDPLNRVKTYTDPVGNVETYNYDLNGNLISKIDRKGQTTSYVYDALDRLTNVTFDDGATIAITWDAGDRVRQLVDSANGTVTRDYDGLDRLTREISPQGQVEYEYDDAGRRTKLTVDGREPVTYEYDDAGRPTRISQGAIVISFTYDAAGRRATVTLANGISGTYNYDDADQLLSIVYEHGATLVGDITYNYDNAGRRVGQGGSLAKMVIPGTVGSAVYDPANRLTSWGASALSYDDNGNLTSDGAAIYSWNARDELVATTRGASGFAYDALGRRISRTVAGAAVSYLHDGSNPVLVNGEQMLAGLGLDQNFARVSSSGVTSLLADALGSTRLLTDDNGNTTAAYAYAPYGEASRSGSADAPFQFTGRENDGASGLYYYRARYYSPQLGRFIQSDPIGLDGGINTYAYVGGDPVSLIDPLGLDIMDPVWEVIYDNTGWAPAPSTVDFWAGMGDTASFGLTDKIRDLHGTNDEVNKCSGAYAGGAAASMAMTPIGRLSYVARAAQIPRLAQTGRQAVSMRNMLRYQYRGPLTRIPFFATWHMRTYMSFVARGIDDAQIIANAGRVSMGWTVGLTAGVPAASAALRSGACECQ